MHRPQARGEILYAVVHHPARQPVVQRIGTPAHHTRLGGQATAGADHQVVALRQLRQQRRYRLGVVLAVAVHEHDIVARGRPGTGLDGGAIALGVGLGNDRHPRLPAHRRGGVRGAVIDHDYLGVRVQRAQPRQCRGQAFLFVFGGDDDGKMQLVLLQIQGQRLLVSNGQFATGLQCQQSLFQDSSLFHFT